MKPFKLIVVFLGCLIIFFTACQKNSQPTVVTTQLTRTQILTQKVWQIDELQRSINGTNSAFVKGGSNTTGVTYQNIKIQFNADGSGTYTNENSMQSSLTWVFSTTDQRNLLINVGGANSAVFEWRMLELKDNYLHCSSPFNSNSLITVRYIQIL